MRARYEYIAWCYGEKGWAKTEFQTLQDMPDWYELNAHLGPTILTKRLDVKIVEDMEDNK